MQIIEQKFTIYNDVSICFLKPGQKRPALDQNTHLDILSIGDLFYILHSETGDIDCLLNKGQLFDLVLSQHGLETVVWLGSVIDENKKR